MSAFEARFPGHCCSCGYRIETGDLATYCDGELMHAKCADADPLLERPVTICKSCWLVQPCDCED